MVFTISSVTSAAGGNVQFSGSLAFVQLSDASGTRLANIQGSVGVAAAITSASFQIALTVGANALTVTSSAPGYLDTIVYEPGMRANDAAWLLLKLDALATVSEERSFEMPMPPHGEPRLFPGVVAATAAVIRWRCEQLGALQEGGSTPVVDAMFSRDEPRTSTSGTLAWAVDVSNPASGESFTLTLKEVQLPAGAGEGFVSRQGEGTAGFVTRPCPAVDRRRREHAADRTTQRRGGVGVVVGARPRVARSDSQVAGSGDR